MPSNISRNVLLNYCRLYVTTTAWILIFRCGYILYIWWGGIDIYCNALVHTTKERLCDSWCVHKVRHNKLLYDTHTHTHTREWHSDMLCMDLWQTVLMKQWNWIRAVDNGCVRELAVDDSLARWLERSVWSGRHPVTATTTGLEFEGGKQEKSAFNNTVLRPTTVC